MNCSKQSISKYNHIPEHLIDEIRTRIIFPENTKVAVLDPLCGDGFALERFTTDTGAVRYGIEPDNGRFKIASRRLDRVIHSHIEDCRIASKSFSLVWLNPSERRKQRKDGNGKKSEEREITWLKRCIPWIAPSGLIVYIIPETIWSDKIRNLLANKFDALEVWRCPEDDFRRLVVIGRRKETDCPDPLPVIRDAKDFLHISHSVPVSNPEVKLFQSTKVSAEEVERLVPHSSCWKTFLNKSRGIAAGNHKLKRPPIPLHSGHLVFLLASGVLDGVVGHNGDSHVVKGKVTEALSTTVAEEISPESGEKITVTRELHEHKVTIKLLEKTGIIRELS